MAGRHSAGGRWHPVSLFEFGVEKQDRIPAFEGLRGVAVLLVFGVHYATLFRGWVSADPADDGSIFIAALRHGGSAGVDLFFIMSGFLIYRGLITGHVTYGRFLTRRVQRIYPAFGLILLIYLLLSALSPSTSKMPTSTAHAVFYLLANILLLPGFFAIDPMVAVTWTLSYEMAFYLVIPLLVTWTGMRDWKPRRRMRLFLGVLLVILILGNLVTWVPTRMTMFVAGILLYDATLSYDVTQLTDRRTEITTVAASVLLASLGLWYGATDTPLPEIGDLIRLTSLGLGIGTICALAQDPGSRIARRLSWSPLRWLGNMSYSFYLVNGLVANLIARAIRDSLHPTDAGSAFFWGFMPVVLLATLAAASALFLLIERPYSLERRSLMSTPVPVRHAPQRPATVHVPVTGLIDVAAGVGTIDTMGVALPGIVGAAPLPGLAAEVTGVKPSPSSARSEERVDSPPPDAPSRSGRSRARGGTPPQDRARRVKGPDTLEIQVVPEAPSPAGAPPAVAPPVGAPPVGGPSAGGPPSMGRPAVPPPVDQPVAPPPVAHPPVAPPVDRPVPPRVERAAVPPPVERAVAPPVEGPVVPPVTRTRRTAARPPVPTQLDAPVPAAQHRPAAPVPHIHPTEPVAPIQHQPVPPIQHQPVPRIQPTQPVPPIQPIQPAPPIQPIQPVPPLQHQPLQHQPIVPADPSVRPQPAAQAPRRRAVPIPPRTSAPTPPRTAPPGPPRDGGSVTPPPSAGLRISAQRVPRTGSEPTISRRAPEPSYIPPTSGRTRPWTAPEPTRATYRPQPPTPDVPQQPAPLDPDLSVWAPPPPLNGPGRKED